MRLERRERLVPGQIGRIANARGHAELSAVHLAAGLALAQWPGQRGDDALLDIALPAAQVTTQRAKDCAALLRREAREPVGHVMAEALPINRAQGDDLF